jgi:hypothetical protein
LRLISQEMSREIWYARRKKTSRYGHSHEKYFFATDANLVLVSICDFRSVPLFYTDFDVLREKNNIKYSLYYYNIRN